MKPIRMNHSWNSFNPHVTIVSPIGMFSERQAKDFANDIGGRLLIINEHVDFLWLKQ